MPNGTSEEWAQNWRKRVDTKLDELAQGIQSLASEFAATRQTIRDMRTAPENARNWLGFAIAAVMALIALLAIACNAAGVAVAIWAILSHP